MNLLKTKRDEANNNNNNNRYIPNKDEKTKYKITKQKIKPCLYGIIDNR